VAFSCPPTLHQSSLRLLRSCALSVLLTCPAALAQEGDSPQDPVLDEIARRFGAQAKAVTGIERLGGRVEYEDNNPRRPVVGVNLSRSKATDDDLMLLRGLPYCESLDLSGTRVTDAGLIHLKGLNEIGTLKVGGSAITDAGVQGLERERVTSIAVLRMPSTIAPYFPGGVFFPKGKWLDESVAQHLSEQLFAMKEPSLWKLSKDDRTATVYRFLWLATNEHPICVRISKSGEDYSLHVARHDGGPGLTAGKITINEDVKLSAKQGKGLIGRTLLAGHHCISSGPTSFPALAFGAARPGRL
jgi:hypothetical protein